MTVHSVNIISTEFRMNAIFTPLCWHDVTTTGLMGLLHSKMSEILLGGVFVGHEIGVKNRFGHVWEV